MTTKRKNESTPGAPVRRAEPGTLIRRLMQRITRSAPDDAERGDQPPPELRPPGRRSGRGTESIAAYLDHARNTKPGPLE